jgi:hypothetical protein
MSTDDIQARVTATRADLENTLDAIEDKLNVPKQLSRLGKQAEDSYEKNPVPWIAGAGAVAVLVVSVVAWALFSDD